ncbi:MAG TPA: STAS domain-containing protein [Planctomicrobium sp.]|nr:STAS domain-containing protein [Planctomicrobium sp.]
MSRPILEVYQTGLTTVVGFGGRDILGDVNVALCRDELIRLIEQQHCHVLAFDLTGVRLLPSGLLGLLSSLRSHEVEVHLYNPSDDIQEVLEITRLKTLMPVHFVDVPRPE